MQVDFDFKKFDGVYESFIKSKKTYNLLYGGSGSGKSYFIARYLIYHALINTDTQILVVRDVATTLNDTIVQEFLNALEEYDNLKRYYKYLKIDKKIIFENGSVIYFKGLDNVDKLKGINASIVFLEEADQIASSDFEELERRLRSMKNNAKITFFILFNPVSEDSWLFEMFFDNNSKRKKESFDINSLKVTFLNNLMHLPASYIKNLLNLEKSNYEMFKVYAKGLFGRVGESVFTNYHKKELSLKYLRENGFVRIGGMDLGFSKDELVVLEAYVNKKTKELYIANEFYRNQAHINDVIAFLKANDMQRLKIIADDNEPRFLQDLRNLGVNNLQRAYKKDAKMYMFYVLQSYTIYCSSNAPNTYKELDNFVYKVDKKTGRATNEMISNLEKTDGDHAISALRYLLQEFTDVRNINLHAKHSFKLANNL